MNAILQISIYMVLLIVMARLLGGYMYRIFTDQPMLITRALRPVERGIYKLTGVDERQEMQWTVYAVALIAFNLVGFLLLYALERLQGVLPFNPRHFPGVNPVLAFNTAVSFVTNTNWQAYSGESTMSNFTLMAGLTVQNFASAATGIAIAIALIRGFARRSAREVGNFWVDLTRTVLYLLLPICVIGALVLVWRGVPQTLGNRVTATTVQGAHQLIARAPVASEEIIKELGTNGGGMFNANSAHPFENPTPFTNLLEMLAILAIPAGLTYTFGKMIGSVRQGWAIFTAMSVLFLIGVAVTTIAEQHGNPLLTTAGADQQTTVAGEAAPGGNMEGKEDRFGITDSSLFAVVTTVTSSGAVNSMHDSLTPLGGLVPLANIGLGEVIFGGVGSGLYGMLVFAITAIFIAGLMVGRTPEYLGKKIEAYDMKMAMLTLLVLPLAILGFTALAAVTQWGLSSIENPGPHGLSEILYAYTSSGGNNGSAFAGLNANTPFYNITTALAMLIGRYLMIVPVMALAGSLAAKKRLAATSGTFPTTGPLWIGLLIGVIVIVGALTYFPAYSLGPIIEHLQMMHGVTFAAH